MPVPQDFLLGVSRRRYDAVDLQLPHDCTTVSPVSLRPLCARVARQFPSVTRYRPSRSWFIIDFVSVLPFDLTSTMLSTDGVKSLQIVRVLRVAKLAKLARVMRLARIHARWERDMDVPFATLALGKFAAYMLTMTHWFACLWGLLGSFQTAEDEAVLGFTTVETSWLQAFDFQDKPAFDVRCACGWTPLEPMPDVMHVPCAVCAHRDT